MSDSARSDATSARRPTGKRAHDPANRQDLRALALLVALFRVQRYGTGRIGAAFGWVMRVWFTSIAAAGLAWFSFVFPALILCYFGQGALYLAHGNAITNPFYEMFPAPLLIPMVVLATMAAIIASQALNLERRAKQKLLVDVATTTYDLGRQTWLTTGTSRAARWRKMLFSFLAHHAKPPTVFFQLPPNRVVELGLQIEL
jgi:K+ transporter